MKAKVVVITGATSGIGQVAAERLAAMGARIIQVARNRARAEAALKRLRERSADIAHSIYYADLLRLGEMKRVAAEIAAAEARIDVLINNAGAMFSSRQLTEDGLERTFALNHMSYFVLTQGLRERLIAAAPARVVNTASDAHESAKLDFDDLQSENAYRGNWRESLRHGGPGFKVYSRSKLCNILFTRELARRLTGNGVTANCLHPGFVATRFGDQSGGVVSVGVRVAKLFALSPEKGAETLVYLAASPEVAGVTGKYFHKCRPILPSEEARADAAAKRLWQETARIADLPD
ncbi:MAG TPA: SDR family NAD(P)-dependent oxidoreductase [Terriglobia bacterium]|nr:SDR family NAD(P)-dependent oxidoreductase [Terriglobia bacterium]